MTTAPDMAISEKMPTDNEMSNSQADLLTGKIADKTAKVAIIGMGYVGLPLAACVGKVGYHVVGVDINPKRVGDIEAGHSYIADVANDELKSLVDDGLLSATTDTSVLADADIIIICVPTPLTKNHSPDTSYIEATARHIATQLRPGQLITLESTTYPGTTEELLQPILEQTGLTVGEQFFLAHSPERVDPGNERYTTHNTNKLLGGVTEHCNQVASAFYQNIIQHIVAVSSPGCAELVKVFENTFRAVNIALVNELALLCDKMDLNIWEVVEAAGTKPFGMMSFYPGPGVGGHCIPIDPFYLAWKAREYNFQTRFIELAGEINRSMPNFVREKVLRALGKQRKPLYGSKVLLLGMAYKANLGDWRDSPAVDILKLLQQDEAIVAYHDPYVPSMVDSHGQTHTSVPLTEVALADADCVVIITAHSDIDYHWVVEHSPVVVDTRNATKYLSAVDADKVVLL
jgi:UDP-N-acetyl-D-glucosamine dehydrogenase